MANPSTSEEYICTGESLADDTNTRDSSSNNGTVSTSNAFNYDEILENHLGQLGKFQLRSFLLLCLPAMFHGSTIMSYIFTGGVPLYRCKVPGCDGVANGTLSEFTPDWLSNNTLPWRGPPENSFAQCSRFNHTWEDASECFETAPDVHFSEEKCNEWVYDQSIFHSTIVTDFDLTCEREWIQTFVGSLFMGGMLVGALTIGTLGDKLGRRLTFTLNAIMLAIVMTASAFSPNIETYCVLRFLSGIGSSGLFLTLFVWGIEAVGKKYRVVCGCIYQVMYATGCILLGMVAYFVRDWRTMQLIIAVPILAPAIYYWIIPESTRWLITKHRYEEARILILKAAEMNEKTVPDHLITTILFNSVKADSINSISISNEVEQKETIMDLFRSTILLKRILIMFSSWMAANMCYYGLTMSTGNLSGDIYLNYELSILVELPGYVGSIFMMDKLGRKPTLGWSLLMGGASCLTAGLIPEEPYEIRIAFSLVGKLCISCTIATMYSFTSELFPTTTRSAAVGLCSVCGRIGAIMAPIIASSGRTTNPSLPYIIFAGTNLAVGVLCLIFLPESNEFALPATIQDAIDMEKKRSRTSLFSSRLKPCYTKKKTESERDRKTF